MGDLESFGFTVTERQIFKLEIMSLLAAVVKNILYKCSLMFNYYANNVYSVT